MRLHTIESLTFRKIKFCLQKLIIFATRIRQIEPPSGLVLWPPDRHLVKTFLQLHITQGSAVGTPALRYQRYLPIQYIIINT